ncbi:MAG: NifB/NifX family molybdenum-iron cluster-binding protein [Verrucomicrobiota bacterium]
MKILVTAKGKQINDEVDPRFGRARFFILVDTETNETTAHDNSQNLNAAQGAGIQAAQNVVRLGAEAVISGNVGPNAFQTLNAAGIKMYLCQQVTVAEAVSKFKAGELKEVPSANVQGHWA